MNRGVLYKIYTCKFSINFNIIITNKEKTQKIRLYLGIFCMHGILYFFDNQASF